MINKRKRQNKEPQSSSSDLMGYGYASKIYNDKLMAQKIENGAFLISWQSNTDYNHCKFDRYDVRHLLDQLDEFDGNQSSQHDQDWRDTIDADCDQERYADLDSDEELLFDMSDAEDREAHVAEKKRRRSKPAGHTYHYDYDPPSPPTIADRSTEIQQIALRFNIPPTSTVKVPTNDDLTMIVETAQAIVGRTQTSNQPLNVCEIQFQVRHSQDPRYDFLNKQHLFYPFYQHVRTSLESTPSKAPTPISKGTETKGMGALVDYGSDSDSDDDNQQPQQKDEPVQRIPSDIMEIIDKTAASVAKVGCGLEDKVRRLRSQDPRFAFLQPHHPYHSYYQRQLELKSKQG